MADLNTPTSVSTSEGNTATTNRPQLTMNGTLPATSQRIYGEWQLARDAAFSDSLITVIGTASVTGQYYQTGQVVRGQVAGTGASVVRVNGTWYLRGRYRDNLGNVSSWSPVATLSFNVAAPQQQAINEPFDGGTYQTNRPTCKGSMIQNNNALLTLQFQFATDSGFTQSVRNEYATPAAPYTGIVAQPTDDISLFQGVWYVRLRGTDELGQSGNWSPVRSFTVTHVPSASIVSPSSNSFVAFTDPLPFEFAFSDPEPTDVQTAYQMQIEQNAGPIPIYEPGKVASSTNKPTVSIATSYKDVVLRWRARVWDSDDKQSNWSGYQLFTMGDKPVVTIASSVKGVTLTTGRPVFTWSSVFGGGRTQRAFQAVVKRGSYTVYDSGVIASTTASWQPDTSVYENNTTYTTTITVFDSGGLAGSDSSTNALVYDVSSSIPFYVNTQAFGTLGYVEISWQPSTDANFKYWRVYRREASEPNYSMVFQTANPVITSWRDWSPVSLGYYRYFMVQVSNINGNEVESPAPLDIPSTQIVSEFYWLVDLDDTTRSIRLNSVTSDSFTDELETATFTVKGRGRRVEIGTDIGYNGSISAQLRYYGGVGPREQRLALERAHREGRRLLMRNPFGDIVPVSIGNIATNRIAGVATNEFVDVTIPYLEVY